MPRFHTIFNVETGYQIDIPFTPAEESARDKEEIAAKEQRDATLIMREAEAMARITAREKLVSLGLTEVEIDALTSAIAE